MIWFYLIGAGLAEIARTISQKYAVGTLRLRPSASLKLLSQQPEIR